MLGNIFYDYKGDFVWSSVAAGVSLFAAILSIVGVIVGVYINRKTQKDIAKQQIDANLKAKARIDWIEKVRGNSSNLLVQLLSLQKENANFNERWESIEQYSELLKLYFSSKKVPSIKKEIRVIKNRIEMSDKAKKIILNEKSNDNKNQYMIRYIDCLITIYQDNSFEKVKKTLALLTQIDRNILDEQMDLRYYDKTDEFEDGMRAYKPNPDYEEKLNDLEKKEYKIGKEINQNKIKLAEFSNAVNEFSLIISLYLKIEWDKAKEGK